MSYLDNIHTPADIRKLNIKALKLLAQEVRERIITVLSKNGGHLASNLGTVELTLALHYVFSSPRDALLFDVSHQTYTHKLVTGRNDERFDKIRKSEGLSGFAHPKESRHDPFYAGHAGTALSLALGMAHTRDLLQHTQHIVALIGDATLTCGLSLEALNNIPKQLGRFLVILNDNEMSISKNVGGITNILSRLLSNPTTSKWSHELESLLSKIPLYGGSLAKQGVRLAESVKNLVSTAPFFEQFGLSYIGPVDGHDLKKLIPLFHAVKDLSMPILIHTYTKKGQGLKRAESDPTAYHGVKPFDPNTCIFVPSPGQERTFPKIFGKLLVERGAHTPRLLVVTPAMSRGSCLDSFQKAFPNRLFDVGIAEGHAVTFSGGLAKTGDMAVVCSIYATFLQRALDNVFHDICLQEIPLLLAIDRAGLSAEDGATHHGIYDMGFLRTMPNLVICQPRNGDLLKELFESSWSWRRPTAIRYPNLPTEETEGACPVYRPLGKGEILARGNDLLIIALGHLCSLALEIRADLSQKGIEATVVDPIFVKPLDGDLLSSLLLTHRRLVVLEEHSMKGGLGSEIGDFLLSYGFGDVDLLHLGIPDQFIEQGEYSKVMEQLGLTKERILHTIQVHFSLHADYVEQSQ